MHGYLVLLFHLCVLSGTQQLKDPVQLRKLLEQEPPSETAFGLYRMNIRFKDAVRGQGQGFKVSGSDPQSCRVSGLQVQDFWFVLHEHPVQGCWVWPSDCAHLCPYLCVTPSHAFVPIWALLGVAMVTICAHQHDQVRNAAAFAYNWTLGFIGAPISYEHTQVPPNGPALIQFLFDVHAYEVPKALDFAWTYTLSALHDLPPLSAFCLLPLLSIVRLSPPLDCIGSDLHIWCFQR